MICQHTCVLRTRRSAHLSAVLAESACGQVFEVRVIQQVFRLAGGVPRAAFDWDEPAAVAMAPKHVKLGASRLTMEMLPPVFSEVDPNTGSGVFSTDNIAIVPTDVRTADSL